MEIWMLRTQEKKLQNALKNFKNFVQKWHRKKKFIIVIGGGQLCRMYQRAASQITNINNEDRDWLGIHITRSNAHLLRTIFREIADPVVIDNVDKIKNLKLVKMF